LQEKGFLKLIKTKIYKEIVMATHKKTQANKQKRPSSIKQKNKVRKSSLKKVSGGTDLMWSKIERPLR
jgi:hypothetical protein